MRCRKDVGDIVRINTATGAQSTFLDIPSSQFSAGGERGVLGLAFHPDYADNGRFFVFLTNPVGSIEVREYARSANPAVAVSCGRTNDHHHPASEFRQS